MDQARSRLPQEESVGTRNSGDAEIDVSAISYIAGLLGAAFVDSHYAGLPGQADELLSRITAASGPDAGDQRRRAAHELKSMLSSHGLTAAANLAGRYEDVAMNATLSSVDRDAISTSVVACVDAVRAMTGADPSA